MPKSEWDLPLYSLEDLDDAQFKRFTSKLIDSQLEPRVRRADVQGKDRGDVARKLIDTFTERRALGLTVRLLKEVGYNQTAEDLEKDAAANGCSLSLGAESEARHKAGSADGVSITKTAQTLLTTQTGCSAPQPFFQDDNVTQSQGSGGIAGSGGATGLAGATGSPPGGLDQTDSCSMLIPSSPSFKKAIFREKGQEVYPVLDKGARKRLALLINNITFDDRSLRRNRAQSDGENVEKLLIGLGYEVVKDTNLSGQEIDEALKSFAGRPEHAESDSTFVVIMSHGKRDKILGVHYNPEGKTKPDIFPVDNIYTHLNTVNCPALLNKPKVILIEACRGDTKSYRNRMKGALFIKFLVEVFNTNAHKNDVEELFRQIIRKFEGFFTQMVCKERTTLGKLFYLFPGL